MSQQENKPSRRGFLLNLGAGASVAGAAVVASPAKASVVGAKTVEPKGVSAGSLSDHAKKYYRSTMI